MQCFKYELKHDLEDAYPNVYSTVNNLAEPLVSLIVHFYLFLLADCSFYSSLIIVHFPYWASDVALYFSVG